MSFIIVDYSKGNLRSVQKAFELAGVEARISADAHDIYDAEAIVLPGVGSFADAAVTMQANGQRQAIREQVRAGTPFFGICLGMQLLFERGTEGAPEDSWTEGLGILKGTCERIASVDSKGMLYKIPHVGWNQVELASSAAAQTSGLFKDIEDGSNFYFTHSYSCRPTNEEEILATTTHAQRFVSVVGKDHIVGVQFHPEKSSHKGLAIIKNFVNLVNSKGRSK